MTIIDTETLLKADPESLLLVDTRNVMGDKEATDTLLFENPIKNTIHIPEHPYMVQEGGHNNGRSPIPEGEVVEKLYDTLKSTGKEIILFAQEFSFFHTRLYVVFKLYGFETKLYIGDLEVLKKVAEKVSPVNIDLPTKFAKNNLMPDTEFYTTIDEVEKNIKDNNHLLIDVRNHSRYLGEGDYLDPKSGHIPTAVNIPNTKLFVRGEINLEVLQEELEMIHQFDKVTVSCGSGMSATPMFTFLNFHQVPVKLYGGSFSEWVKEGKDLETKEVTLEDRVKDIE